uniref:tRNA-guanine(34) transglycosylase n=2 Tax=Opuntia streptacantha TaxID=393608 RepID=A0A7C8ZGC5_OPUST
MYDCVYPTRTARFGTALIPEGVLKLKHHAMAEDTRSIDPSCSCMVCKTYTRAYIHCLVTKDAMGSQLVSYHNLYYMIKLSRDLHTSIIEGSFPELYAIFYRRCFPKGMYLNGSAMPWMLLESISCHAVILQLALKIRSNYRCCGISTRPRER